MESSKGLYEKAEMIAESYGVTFKESELFLEADMKNAYKSMERLLDTITSVSYLIYRRSHRKTRTFSDELELFFSENDIDAETSHHLAGRITGHTVPFFINSDKIAVSPFSTKLASVAVREIKVLGFVAKDVKEAKADVRFSVVLDDREPEYRTPWRNEAIRSILRECVDYTVEWRNRDRLLEIINAT